MLAAGGTAGHVFPALAIYRHLTAGGATVTLVTDERGRRWADDFAPTDVTVVPSGGIVTGSVTKRIRNLGRLAVGLGSSVRLLRRLRPDVVIGLGGYGSVGPLLAAQQLGIPNVLHEQNSVMGRANQLTARRADAVALSFDPTEGARGNCVVTGNPCRPEVQAIGDAPYATPGAAGPVSVLVMGGSQGARFVSERVPAALRDLDADLRQQLHVIHQARAEDTEAVAAAYAAAGIDASIETFVDVPTVLRSAALVIARSGASTVADVAVARRPAIYLPLLTHADLQQVKNAAGVISAGGALMHREDEHGVAHLTGLVDGLLRDPNRMTAMADAARTWSTPDAVERIVDLVR